MNFKLSTYNISTTDLDGSLLFGNLLTNDFVKIDPKDIQKFDHIRNQTCLTEDNLKDVPWMKEKGFVVQEDVDEYNQATMKYYDSIFSNDALDITLIPTDDCNFKCIYCYQEDRVAEYMSDETVESILKFIQKNGSKYNSIRINWFGGEPLMATDMIIDFMQRCKKICTRLRKPLTGAISTNGYNLDLDTFQELLKNHVLFYQITVDGTEENHNTFRPHLTNDDSYGKIIENLKQINEKVKRFYKINVRVNITNSIVRELDDFLASLDFMKGNKNFRINWQQMSDYGGEQIDEIKDEIVTGDTYYKVLDKFTENKIPFLIEVFLGVTSGVCSASRKNSFYIDPAGKVYKCSLAIYDETCSDDNTIAEVGKDGITEFDEVKMSKWLIRDQVDEACKRCNFYPICGSHYCQYRRKFTLKRKVCYAYKSYLPFYIRNMSMQGMMEKVTI